MKKLLTILIVTLFTLNTTQAQQIADGSVAPNFTFNDLNGVTHTLYDYLDNGYTVFVDFSAVWCGPCWGYHTSGALENLYADHGPVGMPNVSASTTDDVMVIFIETDGSDLACLEGTGCGTHGDWVTGTHFPIMCTGADASGNIMNTTSQTSAYGVTTLPTVFRICPDKIIYEISTAVADPYTEVSACAPPAWSCTGTSCIDVGVGNGTFFNVNECINNCNIAQSWTCKTGIDGTVGQGDCVDPGDGTGNHTSQATCEQTCIKNSYHCIDGNGNIVSPGSGQGILCVNPGDESGGFPTLVGCQVVCGVAESWECNNDGHCEDPGDGSGSYSNVTDCINLSGCLAPNDIKNIDYINVSIFPNPVSELLRINGKYSEINIFDLYGKLVLTSRPKKTVDISSLSNGIYLVKINNNTAISINKIIVNH
jgi:hypothetical protein